MPLDLSSLDTLTPQTGLDLSGLDNFASATDDLEKSFSTTPAKNPQPALDLSSLDNLFSDKQEKLKAPTEETRSKFGLRKDPFLKITKFHNGIDYKFPLNTPVKSLGKGIVIDVGDTGKKDYGKFVTVDYGGGLRLTYGHLNEQKVEVGDRISSEAIVGLSGSTGRSKGPHLHLKASLNGQPVDPNKYFQSSNEVAQGITTDEDLVDKNPTLDLSSLDKPIPTLQEQKLSKNQISISGAAVIHHLGFDPNKVESLSPAIKSHLISVVKQAVDEDERKRNVGQKEFVVDFDYQNSMRKKIGLPKMNSIMQQYTYSPQKETNNGIQFTNHDMFPVIYNIASTVAPLTQAVHRNNLVENNIERIRNQNRIVQGTNLFGAAGLPQQLSEDEIRKRAEAETNEQLVVEEQQRLDYISRTAKFTKDFINAPSLSGDYFPGLKNQDIRRGLAGVIGHTAEQIGSVMKLLYPSEADEIFLNFGRKVQMGAELNREENPIDPYSYKENLLRGIGEGIGRSPELIKLFAGAKLLTLAELEVGVTAGSFAAVNLPAQGAISGLPQGIPGVVEGIKGGLIYHYGGKFTSPYLGRVGNSLLWISAPAAEAHLISGQDLAAAIGENIPMGLFIGISGGERAKVIDNGKMRSANFLDIPKVMSGELKFVPPSFRTVNKTGEVIKELSRRFNSVPLDIEIPKTNFTIPIPTAEANLRLLDLKRELSDLEAENPRVGRTAGVKNNEGNLTPILNHLEKFTTEEQLALNSSDGMVTIYRAVKKGASIQAGDHVTLREKDAQGYADRNDMEVISMQVPIAAVGYMENPGVWPIRYTPEGRTSDPLEARKQKIQDSIDVLEKGIPEDVKKFYVDNEEAIRSGINTEIARKVELEKQPIYKAGKLREDIGTKNILGTTPQKAEDILKNFTNITQKANKLSVNLGIPYADILAKKVGDLGYLSAFFIEDFYHRGIEPTISLVRNRLRETLGDFSNHLKDETLKEAYQKGLDYFKSNDADPFFSRMKQDAAEKLPNRMTAEQALNVLKGHKNEFEWTVGLEAFLNDKKVEKFSKQELIDIINKGQVRVEVSVASELPNEQIEQRKLFEEAARYEDEVNGLIPKLGTKYPEFIEAIKYIGFDQITDTEKLFKAWPEPLAKELYEISLLREKVRTTREAARAIKVPEGPKYSLKAYTGEKLELPGAVNSKEVKLISVTKSLIGGEWERYSILDREANSFNQAKFGWKNIKTGDIMETTSLNSPSEIQIENIKYQAPHWDEPNVVAHYRSNDRTTTDGIKISHSEEFQSDWNHDIREYGLKVPDRILKEKIDELRNEQDSLLNSNTGTRWKEQDRNEQINYEIIRLTEQLSRNRNSIEPNPFMSHAWKELVFKRFLRDAVVAKDENGNYKYDGISWTTARQQLIRNNGLMEGKDFTWQKLPDGNYNFTLIQDGQQIHPHELVGISLERFAELTTKEAAEEVRSQEAKNYFAVYHRNRLGGEFGRAFTKKEAQKIADKLEKDRYSIRGNYQESYPTGNTKNFEIIEEFTGQGKFSLKEAVELRSGIGKYSDYDVAFVNNAKKIGKRFGAGYSLKEIDLGRDGLESFDKFLAKKGTNFDEWSNAHNQNEDLAKQEWANKLSIEHYAEGSKAKVHFLEITPSMRESLSKEGFPFYGLGGSEKVRTQDLGTRNSIVSSEVFDQHRNGLVKALEENRSIQDVVKDDSISKGTVFNSGLSPDAFIDQAKLLYKGIREFSDFSKQLVTRFGEAVNPFIQDLWIQVKDLHKNFNSEPYKKGSSGTFNMGLDLSKLDPRNLGLTKKKGALEYLTDPTKHQSRLFDYRFMTSSTGLAQLEPKFGEVYNDLVAGQRVTNRFNSYILNSIQEANSWLKNQSHDQVGKVLYNGLVEEGRVFSRAELLIGNFVKGRPALSDKQADAYENLYKAQHLSLDLRKETLLHSMRDRLNRFDAQARAAVVGSPEEASALKKKIAVAANIKKTSDYYDKLKSEGYFSLQRKGPIAAFVEGANGEKIYQQFEAKPIKDVLYKSSLREAQKWIDEQIANGAKADTQSIYDIRKSDELQGLSKKLSIGAFEDLVDSAGVNSHSPEIQKLRDEIYSQFPSHGYELKRDFTLGYDRTWESAVASVLRQAELYSSSFYSRVSKEEALKTLSNTGLQKSDPNLYELSKAYIEDETIFTGATPTAIKALGKARQAVYVIKLGYDFSQLYLNAIFQPITQNYAYLARVQDLATGNRLKGAEPDKYFIRGTKLSLALAKDYFTKTKVTYQNPNFVEFKSIYDRLVDERIVEPEFSKSLLELETDTLGKNLTQTTLQKLTSPQQHIHWSSIFMRAGEKATRTQMAATLFLVGKEKFGYSGEQLTDFMVQGINATQSNPTRGDLPYRYRRTFGASMASMEIGKLVGQFNKFNQMWVENLALSAKADFEKTWETKDWKDLPTNVVKDLISNKARALQRTIFPLVILGGLRGLPLAGLAFTLYTLFTGNDPKDKFDKAFKDHKTLEQMALYGVTGNAGFSQKVTPNVPFIDTIGTDRSTIPLFSTAEQIIKGMYDLSPLTNEKDNQKGVEELLPSAISRLVKARRYSKEGIPVGKSKKRATRLEYLGQGIGITPSRTVESYNKIRTEKLKAIHKKLFK